MDDALIGSVVGDYEIQERIGKGGMGVVYRARQISLDRPVAIKVLPTELSSDHEYVDRFLREARAAAHLNHPHIIQIFDAGVFDDIYFFVMEFVDGQNLGQVVRERGCFEEGEALAMIQQAAEGLAFAHRTGIVHRDVKPENIMLTSSGVAKIGDLGLAKWKPNEFDATLTHSGSTMGTPYYISPEQIRGWKDIDGRADIYSLGMTLYHLLNGKPAFCEGTAAEIMARHLSDAMPPLDFPHGRVSAETLQLIAAMTVKKREDRIQEMAEISDLLAEKVGRSRFHTPTRGVRKDAARARDGWGRIWNVGIWGIVAILVVLFLTLGVLVAWKAYQGKRSPLSPLEEEAPPETPVGNVLPTPAPVPSLAAGSAPREKEPESPQHASPPISSKTPDEGIEKKSSSAPAGLDSARVAAPDPPPVHAEEKEIVPIPVEEAEPSHDQAVIPENSETEESAPAENRLEGLRVIREITITSRPEGAIAAKKRSNERYRRWQENDWEANVIQVMELAVGKVGADEFRSLVRAEFESLEMDPSQFAQRFEKCTSAVLEVTPVWRSPDASNLEIEVGEILKPWGSAEPSHFNLHHVKGLRQFLLAFQNETNWERASSEKKEKWWRPGAYGRGNDYSEKPLVSAENEKKSRFKISQEPLDEPLRLNILPGLRRWMERMKEQKEWIPHYGWILYVSGGAGEVRFASSQVSPAGPRLILTTSSSKKGDGSRRAPP